MAKKESVEKNHLQHPQKNAQEVHGGRQDPDRVGRIAR